MHEAANTIFEKLGITKLLYSEPDVSSTASGAISLETLVTFVTSAGAESRTLANGREGQIKIIIAKATLTGTVTVTPTNLANGTNIVLDAAGDGWIGIFHYGEWHSIGSPTAGALS